MAATMPSLESLDPFRTRFAVSELLLQNAHPKHESTPSQSVALEGPNSRFVEVFWVVSCQALEHILALLFCLSDWFLRQHSA
eukprot:4898546-Amphidinium_carterae.1